MSAARPLGSGGGDGAGDGGGGGGPHEHEVTHSHDISPYGDVQTWTRAAALGDNDLWRTGIEVDTDQEFLHVGLHGLGADGQPHVLTFERIRTAEWLALDVDTTADGGAFENLELEKSGVLDFPTDDRFNVISLHLRRYQAGGVNLLAVGLQLPSDAPADDINGIRYFYESKTVTVESTVDSETGGGDEDGAGGGGGTSFRFVDDVPDTDDAVAGVIYVRNSDDSHWTLRASSLSAEVLDWPLGQVDDLYDALPATDDADFAFVTNAGATGRRWYASDFSTDTWTVVSSTVPATLEATAPFLNSDDEAGDRLWMGRANGSGASNHAGAGSFENEAAALASLASWPLPGNGITPAYDSTKSYIYHDEELNLLREITSLVTIPAAVVRLGGGGLAPTTLPDPLTTDHVGTIFNEAGHLLEITERHRDGTLTVTWTHYGLGTTIGNNVGALWGLADDAYRFRGVRQRGSQISGSADDDVYVNPGGGWFYYNETSGQATGYLHLRAPDGGSLHDYEWRGIAESQEDAEELLTGDGQIFVWGNQLHVSSDYERADAIASIHAEPYGGEVLSMVRFWGPGQTEPLPAGQVSRAGLLYSTALRYRFKGNEPDEVLIGSDPGIRALDAADVSDADVMTSSGEADEVLPDMAVIMLPAGHVYRLHLIAQHDLSTDVTASVWMYEIMSGQDDIVRQHGVGYSTTVADPLGQTTANEATVMDVNIDRVFDFRDRVGYLTIIGATFTDANAAGNWYLEAERLS